ncbi:MAG: hypothetical protein HYZ15_15325 [Sphingobacteriales bacterium]|nr:hypothetical protein [Sphingobacteriales bacterium]
MKSKNIKEEVQDYPMRASVLILLIVSWLLFLGCKQRFNSRNEIEVGEVVSEKISLLTSASQFDDGYEIKLSNICYRFTIDDDKKINNLFVYGDSFKTPEGLSVKSTYKEVKVKSLDTGRMVYGWGYIVNLKSGWCVLFSNDNIIEDECVNDTTYVSCFFKSADFK